MNICITRFSNDRRYFYPPKVGPVYFVRRKTRATKCLNRTHLSRCNLHYRRKEYYAELEIVKSKATLDPLSRDMKQKAGYIRFYSIQGNGRDWMYNELDVFKDEALNELNWYRGLAH